MQVYDLVRLASIFSGNDNGGGTRWEEKLMILFWYRSLQPLVMSLLDPDGVQTLRVNREKLSHDITNLINEYGPEVFPDFDGKSLIAFPLMMMLNQHGIAEYISRTTKKTDAAQHRPAATRSSSFSWSVATTPSRLPKIASGFFQQAVRMGLDDKSIFNWGRIEEDGDDNSFYLGRLNGSLTPATSRRGSASESDAGGGGGGSSSATSSRSRAGSFGNDGFRVEAMTSLAKRPKFKIEDYDEKKKLEDEGYAGDREEDEHKKLK